MSVFVAKFTFILAFSSHAYTCTHTMHKRFGTFWCEGTPIQNTVIRLGFIYFGRASKFLAHNHYWKCMHSDPEVSSWYVYLVCVYGENDTVANNGERGRKREMESSECMHSNNVNMNCISRAAIQM